MESCQSLQQGSWGRLGSILHAQAPTPHTPALQSFLADFSQQTAALQRKAKVCFQGSPESTGCRIDGVCGAGATHYLDLPREAARSRSAPEKVCNLDPMAPVPVKNVNYPRAPKAYWRSRRTPYYPTDSQLQVYDIYTREGYFGLPTLGT